MSSETTEGARPLGLRTYKPARERAKHLHWIADGEFSASTGTPLPYLCGRWGGPYRTKSRAEPVKALRVRLATGESDVAIQVRTADCKACHRVLRAFYHSRI